MGKFLAVAAGAMAVVVGLAVVVVVAAGTSSARSGGTASASGRTGGDAATSAPAVPDSWQALYRQAAAACPGLGWSVLAAVGTVESDSRQSHAPGVLSGANGAGAEGPMQFEPTNS